MLHQAIGEEKQPLKTQKILGTLNNCGLHIGVAEIINVIGFLAASDKDKIQQSPLQNYLVNYELLQKNFIAFYGLDRATTWKQLHELLTVKVENNTAAQQLILGPVLRSCLKTFIHSDNRLRLGPSEEEWMPPVSEEKKVGEEKPAQTIARLCEIHTVGKYTGRYSELSPEEIFSYYLRNFGFSFKSIDSHGVASAELDCDNAPLANITIYHKDANHWERVPPKDISTDDLAKFQSNNTNLKELVSAYDLASSGKTNESLEFLISAVKNLYFNIKPVLLPVSGLAVKHYEPIKDLFNSYKGYTSKITEDKGVLDVYLKPMVEEKTTLSKKENIHLPNQQILRINKLNPADQEQAREILELKDNASDDDIRKAYRQLALDIHPDKNPDEAAVAGEAFKKLVAAKDLVLNIGASAANEEMNFFKQMGDGVWLEGGPLVRTIRDFILSLAGVEDEPHDFATFSQKILQTFSKKVSESALSENEINKFSNIIKKFFPSVIKSSDNIARENKQNNFEPLHLDMLFLRDVAKKLPNPKKQYQQIFQLSVLSVLGGINSKLDELLPVKPADSYERKFDGFNQFTSALLGEECQAENTSENKAVETSVADAFATLDELVRDNDNKLLLSNLVNTAAAIRSRLVSLPAAQFKYSEMELDADAEKAKLIDQLYVNVNRLDVFQGQLRCVMQLIFGKHFSNKLTVSNDHFPNMTNIMEMSADKADYNMPGVIPYINQITGEKVKIKSTRSHLDPYAIVEVIPKPSSSMVDCYIKYYPDCILTNLKNSLMRDYEANDHFQEYMNPISSSKMRILAALGNTWKKFLHNAYPAHAQAMLTGLSSTSVATSQPKQTTDEHKKVSPEKKLDSAKEPTEDITPLEGVKGKMPGFQSGLFKKENLSKEEQSAKDDVGYLLELCNEYKISLDKTKSKNNALTSKKLDIMDQLIKTIDPELSEVNCKSFIDRKSDFYTVFNKNKKEFTSLLAKSRTSRGMRFLKAVATLFTLGIAAAFGIWNVAGEKVTKDINSRNLKPQSPGNKAGAKRKP